MKVWHVGPQVAKRTEDGTSRAEMTDRYRARGATQAIDCVEQMIAWLDTNGLLTIGALILMDVEAAWQSEEDSFLVSVSWRTPEPKQHETPASPSPGTGVLAEVEPADEEWDVATESETIYVPIGAVTVLKPTADTNPLPVITMIGETLGSDPPTGVEWLSGVTSFSVPQVIPRSAATASLWATLESMSGKLNSGVFRGREAQCVQYLGPTARPRGPGQVMLNHRFRSRAPRTYNVAGFAPFTVPGFTYVWDITTSKVEGDKPAETLRYIAHCQVGEAVDFSFFG